MANNLRRRSPKSVLAMQAARDPEFSAAAIICKAMIWKAGVLNKEAPDLADLVAAGKISVKQAFKQLGTRRDGPRKTTRANVAFRRASEFVARIEGCALLCQNVSVSAIKSDRRLLRCWRDSLKEAVDEMRSLQKRLEG